MEPILSKEQIAELFLVLLILVMIDKGMNKMKRSFLFIVFGASLAVSHYGLSYIYMFCLISSWLLLISGENPAIQKLRDNFHSKFSRKSEKLADNPNSLNNSSIRSCLVPDSSPMSVIFFNSFISFVFIINVNSYRNIYKIRLIKIFLGLGDKGCMKKF